MSYCVLCQKNFNCLHCLSAPSDNECGSKIIALWSHMKANFAALVGNWL